MEKQLFSKSILDRAARYAVLGKVKNVEREGSVFYAEVHGSDIYDVSITFDKSFQKVKEMECDCPYALKGYNCKHMAALYLHIKTKKLLPKKEAKKPISRKQKKTLLKEYETLRNKFSYEYYAVNQMKPKIYETLNKCKDNTETMLDFIEQCDEFEYRNESLYKYCYDIIITWIKELDQNEEDQYYQLFKEKLRQSPCSMYYDLYRSIHNQKDDKTKISDLLYLLSYNNVENAKDYLEELYKLYNGDLQENLLETLSCYKKYSGYKYLAVKEYLNKNDIEGLLEYVNSQEFNIVYGSIYMDSNLKIAYYTKDFKLYAKFLEDYRLTMHKSVEASDILILKEIDPEQWNQNKLSLTKTFTKNLTFNEEIRLIKGLKDRDIIIDTILRSYHKYRTFIDYQDVLKELDPIICSFIHTQLLKERIIDSIYFVEEKEICRSLDKLKEELDSKQFLYALLTLIKDADIDYEEYKILESYIKKGEYDEYITNPEF